MSVLAFRRIPRDRRRALAFYRSCTMHHIPTRLGYSTQPVFGDQREQLERRALRVLLPLSHWLTRPVVTFK
jgi:hypothetical protein